VGERHPQTPPVWRHDALITPAPSPHEVMSATTPGATNTLLLPGDENLKGIHGPTTAPCSSLPLLADQISKSRPPTFTSYYSVQSCMYRGGCACGEPLF
jgi:hypothetical protein